MTKCKWKRSLSHVLKSLCTSPISLFSAPSDSNSCSQADLLYCEDGRNAFVPAFVSVWFCLFVLLVVFSAQTTEDITPKQSFLSFSHYHKTMFPNFITGEESPRCHPAPQTNIPTWSNATKMLDEAQQQKCFCSKVQPWNKLF